VPGSATVFEEGTGQNFGKVEPVAEERLLRPREVARRLGVSRSTVYRWFWEGKLRGLKLGWGPVRILESSLTQMLEEAEGDPA
jgi:excisionase family DNA binding protein